MFRYKLNRTFMHLYAKNHKILSKEIKDLNKWRDILYSQIQHNKNFNFLQVDL